MVLGWVFSQFRSCLDLPRKLGLVSRQLWRHNWRLVQTVPIIYEDWDQFLLRSNWPWLQWNKQNPINTGG